MKNYGIHLWSNGDFVIEDGVVKVNYANKPSLYEITKQIRDTGIRGPVLLRFPHLIKKQIDNLFKEFQKSIDQFNYKGNFNAVFPLKVNQFPNFVSSLVEIAKEYNYGLEAGSKAELIIAMAYNNKNAPITVNGFKDKGMITLGFLAAKMGYDTTLTIEGLGELENIIEAAKEYKDPIPNIGLRIRLHSSGIGIWAKSGGINSKFGLTATELLEAMELLKRNDLLEKFTMIHFHIGSQIGEINPVKKALREAGNIYAELKKMGAMNLRNINLGGGLAVEYSQHENVHQRNYTLTEFTNDVVFLLKEIAQQKGVEEPNIFTESGRFIAASHAVLIAPVLELFSQEYTEKGLRLKEKNPPLVQELYDLYTSINPSNAIEYFHDSLDHMESLLTLFDLGYIDLQDRSNTEILVHLIIKKAIELTKDKDRYELKRIQDRVQERYLLNFSLFQSLPDFWGLGQRFPVMPLNKLDQTPTRSASLWDITCDSDGEIDFNVDYPLFLHDVDLSQEEYFLAFFLVGAYQEILGMKHNLFTHPTEVTVRFDHNGYSLENMVEAQSILDILYDLDYDINEIQSNLKQLIAQSNCENKEKLLEILSILLHENNYLKISQKKESDA
ncbi:MULTISPECIES: biosynthetic arginine decarboxylase [unclassified Nitratiruptor]|uniref:biosynthetic arginine decarboxylase n=1 Tax=unclassified Nitratiruptor TaxID=2624044 RepID=UPI00191525B4|nr:MULTISPECIES: biosynthetic arginine decarboxylase [unclassified Nitratiruptor]BCD60463.1 arginine decarboxylase [Nitratiruptor sp. YY08-10]BCD64048.1 arginine decarboxylase [Nitratiruptor sp. YY08-14]